MFHDYDFARELSTVVPGEFPDRWYWRGHTQVADERRFGFALSSDLITFDRQELANSQVLPHDRDGSVSRRFSPDLAYLLASGETIEIDSSLVDSHQGPPIAECHWSFDGRRLIYLIDFERLLVYDVASKETRRVSLAEIKGDHTLSEFCAVAFTPSSEPIVIARHDSPAYAMAVLREEPAEIEWVFSRMPYLSPIGTDGHRVYYTDGHAIIAYDESLARERLFHKTDSLVIAASLAPDGRRLAVITQRINGDEQHLTVIPTTSP